MNRTWVIVSLLLTVATVGIFVALNLYRDGAGNVIFGVKLSNIILGEEVVPAIDIASVSSRELALGTYEVIADQSSIVWEGTATALNVSHKGSIGVATGTAVVAESDGITGAITMDVRTFAVDAFSEDLWPKTVGTSTDAASGTSTPQQSLSEYLRGPHFLDVSTYPDAFLQVVSAERIDADSSEFTIKARLTLHGETHELTFPATIYMRDGMMHLYARFSFDRTVWGITSYSPTFSGSVASGMIDDLVKIETRLVLRKAE